MSDTLQREQAADHAMRHWTHEDQGPVRIGSDTHRRMFCTMLLDTHNPYKPAVIDWPPLAPAELKRLTSLPIWDIAVQTEGRASIRVATYAATVTDPLLRRALEMDGAEEARHKVVLSKLVEAYGIALAPEPPYPAPKDPEWAWLTTGFSECIDSFFAFGLFRSAQRSGFFPDALVETFEPVIQEEGRHILFFVNWYAWYWRALPWWRRPWFFARVAAVWACLIKDRVNIARGIDSDGAARDMNFPANAASTVGDGLDPRELIALCLSENERRMAGYDRRLVRPLFVPRMARLALRFLKKKK
ncbi:ferritin-like domain-containing protein [Burkholderia sp. FERM BP-3421]|uniref:ferritin-like domain-containing protein n=1 Tax=Burkholderia sp. FERM BP-3421 TaxID=1494466 RepID=UPI00235F3FB1|nr:ferritin-like domain-containing protein [Burkholderia sp. FERM BP-3421]WDD91491.1 ferritin-like domain-containing protein [Burkholderia sp. FERM BP-3421]